jgi:hypothetical protein
MRGLLLQKLEAILIRMRHAGFTSYLDTKLEADDEFVVPPHKSIPDPPNPRGKSLSLNIASIYNPGKIALLVGWRDIEAAKAWSPEKIDGMRALGNVASGL